MPQQRSVPAGTPPTAHHDLSVDLRADQPRRAADDLELTVLLPCLDEARTLETCIRKAQRSLAALGVAGEVLVADNGSTDGSPQIALRCGARVIDVPVRGYGAAVRAGIDSARGRYVLMADADDSYALDDLGPFLDALRAGSELVMGNRFAGRIEPGAMPALHRYLGNPVLSSVGRLLFRTPVRDFHCGMRAFDRDVARGLGLRSHGMELASELVVRFGLAGRRVVEIPTVLSVDGRDRPSHLRSWRDGWRHLRLLLLFSPRWLFLYPGLLLALACGLLATRLCVGPWGVGPVTLGTPALLLAAAGVAVGVQAVLLGVVSQATAAARGLLPPVARLRAVEHRSALEVGVAGGLLVLLLGAVGTAVAVARPGAVELGAGLRLLVPSVTAVVVGAELLMASFFLGLVRLDPVPARTATAPAALRVVQGDLRAVGPDVVAEPPATPAAVADVRRRYG